MRKSSYRRSYIHILYVFYWQEEEFFHESSTRKAACFPGNWPDGQFEGNTKGDVQALNTFYETSCLSPCRLSGIYTFRSRGKESMQDIPVRELSKIY
jgi:hypothetical protein